MYFVLKAVKSFLIYILYYLCFFIPRKKNLWLYSSLNGQFVDNSKYFFLYANEHCKNVRHVWISSSTQTIETLQRLGFEAYHFNSRKAKQLSLRAGAFIYSSYITSICNAAFAGGAFWFNLWHGIPLKKIEYDITKGPLKFLYNPSDFKEWWKRFCTSPKLNRKNNSVLTTSNELVKIFSHAFRLPAEKIFIGQYPRLMPFGWDKKKLQQHIENIEGKKMLNAIEHFKNYNDVIIYMPTWRDDSPDFISEAIPDFFMLNDVCKKNNALFVFKVHLNTVFREDLNTYSNLLKLDSSLDMYPLLPFSTALVTDYSSIFFDYAVLRKKIIFYPFDLHAYKSKSRELYFNYEEITKGEIVSYTFNELLKTISDKDLEPGNHESFSKFLYTGEFDYDAQMNFIKRSVGIKVYE